MKQSILMLTMFILCASTAHASASCRGAFKEYPFETFSQKIARKARGIPKWWNQTRERMSADNDQARRLFHIVTDSLEIQRNEATRELQTGIDQVRNGEGTPLERVSAHLNLLRDMEMQSYSVQEITKARRKSLEKGWTSLLQEISEFLTNFERQSREIETLQKELETAMLEVLPLEPRLLSWLERVRSGDRSALAEMAEAMPAGKDSRHFPTRKFILTPGESGTGMNHYKDFEAEFHHNEMRPGAFRRLSAAYHPLYGELVKRAAREGAIERYERAWRFRISIEAIALAQRRPVTEMEGYRENRDELLQAARILMGELQVSFGEVMEAGRHAIEIASHGAHVLNGEASMFQNAFRRATGEISENYPRGVRILYEPDLVNFESPARSELHKNTIILSHEDILTLGEQKLTRNYRHERDHHLILANEDLWILNGTVQARRGSNEFGTHLSEVETYFRQARRTLEDAQEAVVRGEVASYEKLLGEVALGRKMTEFIVEALNEFYEAGGARHRVERQNDDFILYEVCPIGSETVFNFLIPTKSLEKLGIGYDQAKIEAEVASQLRSLHQKALRRVDHFEKAERTLEALQESRTSEQLIESFRLSSRRVKEMRAFELLRDFE